MKQFRVIMEQIQGMAQNMPVEEKKPRREKPKTDGEVMAGAPSEKPAPERYQHPDDETLVWVKGTGRKPKWLNQLLIEDWKLEDLLVTEKPKEEELKAEEPKEEKLP
jgi:DNA-binding protein H-NS